MTDALWQLGGWTMLHFLWAGTIAALLGGMVRIVCRRAAPAVRYALSLVTLGLLAALPAGIATWLALYSPVILAGRAESVITPPSSSIRTPGQVSAGDSLRRDGSDIYRSAGPRVVDLVESVDQEDVVASQPASRSTASSCVANPSPSPSLQGRGTNAALLSLQSLVPYLPYAWLLGTPLTFALLATGLVGSERLRRRSAVLATGPAFEACERLRQAMRIARRVSVAACEGLAQPVLVGVVRPLILLPAAALSGWTPEELEMVLMHELAHVRRWDNLVNLMQRIVESLLFFHPAVWLVSRQVRRDREECCDAVVVSRTAQPQRYAELLLSIAAVLPRGQAPRLAAASAMADHPLTGRIRRILKLEDEPMWVSRRTLALTVALPLALVAATVYTAAADEEGQPSAASPLNSSNAATSDEQASEGRRQGPNPSTESTSAPETATPAERSKVPVKRNIQAFHLKYARASMVTLNLEEYFQEEMAGERADRLRFIWDADGNSIVVKNAREEQLATIRDLIELYDQPKSGASLESRLERLRDNIQQMLPLFEPRPDNPVKTVVYRYDKARREFVDHWHYIIGGLQDRPAGTKYTFNWNRKSDHVEISAPAAAHKQLFEPAFSGIDLLAGESEVRGLQPGQEVRIQVVGAFPEAPIDGVFVIEPQGTVALGATYGRVAIAGLSLVEAEKAVAEKLKEMLTDVQVQITLPPRTLRGIGPAEPPLLTPPAFSDAEEEAYKRHGRLPPPKPAYLYDGKTFDEWRDLWKHELKTERRMEAIHALAAFARAGYGRDAAAAIFEVADQYDSTATLSKSEGQLIEAVVDVIARLPAQHWMPLLLEKLNAEDSAGRRRWKAYANDFLSSAQPDDKDRESALKFTDVADDGPLLVSLAGYVLRGDRELAHQSTISMARKALAREPENLNLLYYLGFRHLDKVPEQLSLLLHPTAGSRSREYLEQLAQDQPGLAPELTERLLAILGDPQRSEEHVAAIRALRALSPALRHRDNLQSRSQVIKRLGEILQSEDSGTTIPAYVALARLEKDASVENLPAVLQAAEVVSEARARELSRNDRQAIQDEANEK